MMDNEKNKELIAALRAIEDVYKWNDTNELTEYRQMKANNTKVQPTTKPKTDANPVSVPVLYHGTNREGICGIINKGFIGTKYFDGYGVFLTTDINDALNHGQYVLVFNNPDFKLETDDENDGYYFRGKIKIELVSVVYCDLNDARFIKDLMDGSQYWC